MGVPPSSARRGWRVTTGTMPEWFERVEGNPILEFVDSCLRGVGQVVFMNNPITGLAILVAIWVYSAWIGFAATLGLVASNIAALLLGLDRAAFRVGLWCFNGVLVGAGLGLFLKPHWSAGTMGLVVVLAAFSTVLMASLARVFLGTWAVPPFTFPFNIATLLFLFAAVQLKYGHLGPLINPTSPAVAGHGVPTGLRETAMSPSVVDVSSVLNAILRGISQLFFADKLLSGVIIVLGIAVASRIAAIFALLGSTLGMLTGLVLGANGVAVYHGLWGFNSFDACLAVGGVFYVLSLTSGLLAAACAVFTALIFGAISSMFLPWGLPALTLPFVFGTLTFVLMKGTSDRLTPVEVEDIVVPEEHMRRARAAHAEEPP
jgi:urea transporter